MLKSKLAEVFIWCRLTAPEFSTFCSDCYLLQITFCTVKIVGPHLGSDYPQVHFMFRRSLNGHLCHKYPNFLCNSNSLEVGNLHLTKLSKSGKRHVKLVSLGSLRREKTSNPER